MKVYFIILISLLTLGCDSSQNSRVEMAMPEFYQIEIHDVDVSKQFKDILKKEEIFFEPESFKIMKVKYSDKSKIDALYFEFIESDLPKDRSISLSLPGLEDKVTAEFKASNISFIKKQRHGKSWIVWSEKNSATVHEIIKKNETAPMNEYMDNLNNQ